MPKASLRRPNTRAGDNGQISGRMHGYSRDYGSSSNGNKQAKLLVLAFGVTLSVFSLRSYSSVISGFGFGSTNAYKFSSIPAKKFGIIQWESRAVAPIASPDTRTFWSTAAQWNALYAKHHGHAYYYVEPPSSNFQCMGPDHKTPLQPSWCKVPAILQLQKDHPEIKYWLYLESDAVVHHNFRSQSLGEMLDVMQTWIPEWDVQFKPMVFNQDANQKRGSTYWLNIIKQRSNYTQSLNAGTLLWRVSPQATRVLETWWQSSLDSYENNPLKFEFREGWPLDQDRLLAVYENNHDEYAIRRNADAKVSDYIQIASQPNQMYTDWDRGTTHWCLSHMETANCFIAHYCRSSEQKVEELMPDYYNHLLKVDEANGGLYTKQGKDVPFNRETLRWS